MFENKKVLCSASAYKKRFYLNPEFEGLPKDIKDQLKIICVLFTEEIGGIFTLQYEEDGTLAFRVDIEEDDILFDEIGGGLKIKEIQRTKVELLESLELYYRVIVLHQTDLIDELED
ncbi:MAG: hypothetical protein GX913_03125 [Clostridiales bacterium]|nr:hypothetical protein [Clostridiales bacterium]